VACRDMLTYSGGDGGGPGRRGQWELGFIEGEDAPVGAACARGVSCATSSQMGRQLPNREA
jgi:hypothetical protein